MQRHLKLVTVRVNHAETEKFDDNGDGSIDILGPSEYQYVVKYLTMPEVTDDEILKRVAVYFPAREEYENHILEFKTETKITQFSGRIHTDVMEDLKTARIIPFFSDYEV